MISLRFPTLACAAVVVAALFLHAPSGSANDEMRKELAKIAKAVQQVLEDRGQTTVSVGSFTGPSTFPSTAGPGITQMLTEEIQKLGMSVKTPADVGIEGKFLLQEIEEPDPNNSRIRQKRVALRIKGNLVDRIGRQLTEFNLDSRISDGEFKTDIKREDAVAGALGITGALPPDATGEQRADLIVEHLKNPTSHIAGTRAFAQADSPYAVEIVMGGSPLPLTAPDKLPLCDIPLDKTYVVRIYNFSDYDAAVRLTIDGLSAFTFSTIRHSSGPKKGDPLYDTYIIPPKSSIDVLGWHKTNEQVDSFLVTEFAKSAAVSLKRQADKARVGTIAAQFFAAWSADGVPPPDEPPAKKGEPRGTILGPPLRQNVTEVKRNTGVLRATVCVRYSK